MVELNGSSLTLEQLERIAVENEDVQLTQSAIKNIKGSHAKLIALADSKNLIYGVNTGFGIFADKRISKEQSEKLNRNLIFSHAVATGDPLPEPIVRAAIVIRINALAKGASGIQFPIVQVLLDLLNKGVTPLVSSRGSLGSSGDLCLLAQMGLVILGPKERLDEESGQAFYQGKLHSGKEALKLAKINPVVFTHKDGLALINGATFSAAIAALNIQKAEEISALADCAAALTLESLNGRSDAFNESIHALRNMKGQIISAGNLRKLIKGSTLIGSGQQVQDAYSLRCAPQVHGAVRDTIDFTESIVTSEINAATDNPLMVDEDRIISGGNFHGEPIGLIADYLSIAVSEIGAISERRIFRLMDKNLNNGLPAMLVNSSDDEGLNSGVMILQYTAAALTLENQTLACPDSIKSLPTSANQEDHNANSYNAVVHLSQIIENTYKILAIELYTSARACHLRKLLQPSAEFGERTGQIIDLLQTYFPFKEDDSQWRHDLEKFYDLLIRKSDLKSKLLLIVN